MGITSEAGAATLCARCGAQFACNPGGECWCAKLPARLEPKEGESCFCPECLKREIERFSG